MQRQCPESEKIFANHVSNESNTKIYKELLYNNKNPQVTQLKNGKGYTRHYSEEAIRIAHKFNITGHLGNINQVHNEVSFHTHEDGYYQNTKLHVGRCVEIGTFPGGNVMCSSCCWKQFDSS